MISKLYFNKNKKIAESCRGKKVLDLGIVDHDVRYEKKSGWLHGDLKKVAGEITGIDIDKKAVNILKQKGYDVKQGNAEKLNLKKKFEIIVAGDLIEHLDNPGNFLKSVKKHMNENSEFILTTPNCLSLSNWIEVSLFDKIKYINPYHTHWHDANTIKKVLENNGFELIELSFIIHNPHFIGESFLRYLLKDLRYGFHILCCLVRKQVAPTIFVRARLKSAKVEKKK